MVIAGDAVNIFKDTFTTNLKTLSPYQDIQPKRMGLLMCGNLSLKADECYSMN